MDYLCHAPFVIHSVTLSMVNMLLLLAVLQAGMMAQQGHSPGGILVGFHINILDVHCDDRILLEKAKYSWIRIDICAYIHVCRHTCKHTSFYIHANIHTSTFTLQTCVRTHIHTHVHTYIHNYIYRYMQTAVIF